MWLEMSVTLAWSYHPPPLKRSRPRLFHAKEWREVNHIETVAHTISTWHVNFIGIVIDLAKHFEWTICPRLQLALALLGKSVSVKMHPNQVSLLKQHLLATLVGTLLVHLSHLLNVGSSLIMKLLDKFSPFACIKVDTFLHRQRQKIYGSSGFKTI
jgi:hypothetical protein